MTNQKVYVEFVLDVKTFADNFGFSQAAAGNLDSQQPAGDTPSAAFYFRNLTQTFYCQDSANHNAALGFTLNAGDNIGIAFDTATGKVWARKNGGAGTNTGDPVAGTNGCAVPFSGSYYAIVQCSQVTEQITAKFLSSSWTYAAPTGFTQLAA